MGASELIRHWHIRDHICLSGAVRVVCSLFPSLYVDLDDNLFEAFVFDDDLNVDIWFLAPNLLVFYTNGHLEMIFFTWLSGSLLFMVQGSNILANITI